MKWQWLTNDKKSWIDFNKKDSISIENARENGQHTTKTRINNNNYEINICQLHRNNFRTGKTRAVCCVRSIVASNRNATGGGQSQGEGQYGNSIDFNTNNNDKSGKVSLMKWQWLTDGSKYWIDFDVNARSNNKQYEINISKLSQNSVKTGKIRLIRTVPNAVASNVVKHLVQKL